MRNVRDQTKTLKPNITKNNFTNAAYTSITTSRMGSAADVVAQQPIYLPDKAKFSLARDSDVVDRTF